MGTATLMSTQNADNIAVTGGSMSGVSISGGTITGVTGFPKPASGRTGTFVVNGTTPVTISAASIVITDILISSLNTVGGTVGALPAVKTITAGQLTVAASASDTSTYNYILVATA